ncbi:MAG: hypothetical protein K0V04_41280 [Deltaproteobacteria bacterium]|nr:hypothetical protein [Deltaproteobacteria bacterium]
MSTKTTRRMIIALALCGLCTAGLAYASHSELQSEAAATAAPHPATNHARATTPAPRVAMGVRRASRAETAPSDDVSPVADPKRRLLAEQSANRTPQPLEPGLEGSRPAPEIEARQAQSIRELELAAATKADQARRLGDALTQRADAVRDRVETARAEGDQEEATRQSRILARLEARTQVLAGHAAAFEDEGRDEADGTEPSDDHPHDDHPHEHAR